MRVHETAAYRFAWDAICNTKTTKRRDQSTYVQRILETYHRPLLVYMKKLKVSIEKKGGGGAGWGGGEVAHLYLFSSSESA